MATGLHHLANRLRPSWKQAIWLTSEIHHWATSRMPSVYGSFRLNKPLTGLVKGDIGEYHCIAIDECRYRVLLRGKQIPSFDLTVQFVFFVTVYGRYEAMQCFFY
jgi:hypothetical protein